MTSGPRTAGFVFLFAMIAAYAGPSGSEAQDRGRGDRRGIGEMMREFPVMKSIDADQDGELSVEEIAGAYEALLTIDQNDDGNLTNDELAMEMRGFGRRGGGRRGPGGRGGRGGPGGPGGFARMLPIMVVLDKDADGELFEDEVTDAPKSLLALDADGDGRLSRDELAPSLVRGRGGRGGPGGRGDRGGPGRGGFGGGDGEAGPPLEPGAVDPEDGTAAIPDRTTFERLSYQGAEVLIDTHLTGVEYVKFHIEGAGTDDAKLYFMDTNKHRGHMMFMSAIGLPRGGEGQMRGVLVYRPMQKSPGGKAGLYTFEFEPNDAYPFDMIRIAYGLLRLHAPLLVGNLSYNLLPLAKERYLEERELYDQAGLPVFDEADQYADIAYLPLHVAETFGRLRLMTPDERPGPRDVVLYPTLPNEMPRVAGVITGVRQTPLSHVNLRAIQDDVPNAFIFDAEDDPDIVGLIGKYVHYRVGVDGYEIREATAEEVETHFAALRPATTQSPSRDLSVTAIRSFGELGFDDASSVGVKAANLAALRTLGLGDDLTPVGFAVPFAFYDAFMRHNDFYSMAAAMIGTSDFRRDADTRARSLEQFQKAIKKGKMPDWMMSALDEVQRKFPAGTSIRCRSSTNNEDLPGFSGAGLYDSFTHHPDEGHLSKSIKQVFASLWNYRAYEEREFHRIDHFAAAMGVALHENSTDEQANGVGVTMDILYQTNDQLGRRYYVNAQVGEELVTNPPAGSIAEEILLSLRNPRTDRIIRRSNRTVGDEPVLDPDRLKELRRVMRRIDEGFRTLYGQESDDQFAMEIEFKVSSAGRLFIKQARPWVR